MQTAASLTSPPIGKPTDPPAEWVDVTPALAAEWLTMNTHNRPKKPNKIKLFAKEMKQGFWPVTGATLCFGKSGYLLDGQNRLQAIIDSGATIRCLAVRGLDDDIFDVIDIGTRRTGADVLIIEGYEGFMAQIGPTAVRLASNLMAGVLPYSKVLQPREIRFFVEDHPELMDASVPFLAALPRRPAPLSHGAAAALHFLMAKIDPVAADTFMSQLFHGDNMASGDMLLNLRNYLLNKVMQNQTSTSDYTNSVCAVIKTWNARRTGRAYKHINSLYYYRAGETFPELK